PFWYTAQGAALTSAVQSMVNGGSANYGFEFVGSNLNMKMASARYADVTKSPYLTIHWTSDSVQLNDPTSVHSNGADLTWSHYSGGLGPYATAVLNDSPATYWRLDDLSGGAVDWTCGGQPLNGTANGLFQPGATADGDQAMSFDGSGSAYLEAPANQNATKRL